MHNLYFVRLVARQYGNIVFLFTAEDDAQASALGLSMVADHCRADFKVDKCEIVCQTPNEVLCYEPV